VQRIAERDWTTARGLSEDLEKFQQSDKPVSAEAFRKRLRAMAADGILIKPERVSKNTFKPFRPGPVMPAVLTQLYDDTASLMRALSDSEDEVEHGDSPSAEVGK
jgi:hypothetical protein